MTSAETSTRKLFSSLCRNGLREWQTTRTGPSSATSISRACNSDLLGPLTLLECSYHIHEFRNTAKLKIGKRKRKEKKRKRKKKEKSENVIVDPLSLGDHLSDYPTGSPKGVYPIGDCSIVCSTGVYSIGSYSIEDLAVSPAQVFHYTCLGRCLGRCCSRVADTRVKLINSRCCRPDLEDETPQYRYQDFRSKASEM